MRVLKIFYLLPLFLSFQSFSFDLETGYYEQISSGEKLCPHELIVHKDPEWETTYLEVTYVGGCYSMGPYFYYCQEGRCSNGAIVFEVLGEDFYFWHNRNGDFKGEFTRTGDIIY